MARNWIVQGDPTSSGGKVVTGSPFTDVEGAAVARVTDQAVCPKHKGVFPVVDGDSTLIIDGQPVALHGSSLACGCKVLSAQQMRAFVDAGGGAGKGGAPGSGSGTGGAGGGKAGFSAVAAAGAAILAAGADASSMPFDEAFILKSELTGEPLENRRYRVFHEDGRCEEGVTDQQGMVSMIRTPMLMTSISSKTEGEGLGLYDGGDETPALNRMQWGRFPPR